MEMREFTARWDPDVVEEILSSVAKAELPPSPPGSSWEMGVDRDALDSFRRHWSSKYDWRSAVDELNRYPQYTVEIDDTTVHFVFQPGEGSHRRALLLTHGWPGSHIEFWDVIDRLAFPTRFGGDAADAFDVVIPSLPGYGFSGPPPRVIGPSNVADMWHSLMTDVLGYDGFLAQGGDWGSAVTSHLALRHPDAVHGIHVNTPFLCLRPLPPETDDEAAWTNEIERRHVQYGGYQAIHMKRPASMAWATIGSPLGKASWILERFHDWTELGDRELTDAFPLDRLITNAMLYSMNDRFSTAIWLYRGHIDEALAADPGEYCFVPTGYAAFPGDPLYPAAPESRIRRSYNLQYVSHPARGGHFAAFEEPLLFADDVAAWGRVAWPA